MNTTYLDPFRGSLQFVLDFLERQQLQADLRELGEIREEDLQDLQPLNPEDLDAFRELDDLPGVNFIPPSEEEARMFLDHVHLSLEQFKLVVDANEGIYDRVKQIFFSQHKLFRLLVFSGLVISSIRLKQDWELVQEEGSCEVKKIQALVLKALVTGGLSGIICSFDSKDLLGCFWAKFDMAAERIRSQFQRPQMIEEEAFS